MHHLQCSADQMYCFVVFLVIYGALAISVNLALLGRKPHGGRRALRDRERERAKAADDTFSIVNFANAVVASVTSSIALVTMEGADRSNPSASSPGLLATWCVESVCAYLVVEMLFLIYWGRKLSEWYWEMAKESYREMVIFHAIAQIGLASVVVFDCSYSVALWVIWSELTTVFLGVECVFEQCANLYKRFPVAYSCLVALTTLVFIFQRVLVFFYLLWLCFKQFVPSCLFVLQVGLLMVGSALNLRFAVERTTEFIQKHLKSS